jgi:virginiamycin B lyase
MKLAAVLLASAAVAGTLPGAHAVKVCAAAGPYWPTMTLATNGNTAWIACKDQSRVVRVDAASGRTTKLVRLGRPGRAVRSGFRATWALDSGGTLYRLDQAGKISRRIALGTGAAYNIWVGAGSVWVADDQAARVVRVSPKTNKVVARIRVGDGPASMAFYGASAWVINHRDTTLDRIDLAKNTSHELAHIPGDAPERMVWSHGSLWITGRGTDLVEIDPLDGSVRRTIDIGASGIDLVASGDSIWVPTRSAEVDPTGFPTMDALKRVSISSGAVATVVTASGRVDVHGLAAAGGAVWIADNTDGRLYSVAAR